MEEPRISDARAGLAVAVCEPDELLRGELVRMIEKEKPDARVSAFDSGASETMTTSCPARAFRSEDLPAFRRPKKPIWRRSPLGVFWIMVDALSGWNRGYLSFLSAGSESFSCMR